MSILGDVGAAAADLLGVIDVGSNSVRLVVFEDGARAPDYVFNEKTVCRLGEGLGATGRLNPEGKTAARAALRRFRALAEAMGVREIIGVGTAALREAEDGPAFVDELRRDLNLNLRVITGREEARLAAEGVLFGWPQAEGVIADLGGSSLELATVGGGEIRHVVSTTAGHLRLSEAAPEARRASLSALTAAATALAAPGGDLVLVGGSWRALAKASMSRRGYPLHVLMGYEMEPDDALRLCDWAREADEAKLKKASGAGAARIPSIGAGAEALAHLITALSPRTIIISAYGLREGLVYARMTPSLRAEEPLLAAARAMERRSGRSPGFGAELFDWLAPAFAGFSADKQRLARAACLLHDVNWRAHPDFRSAACFATVTRANLSGVGHRSRMFIGCALAHRYKNPDPTPEMQRALSLLTEEEMREAEALGRAMRLGAMLTGSVAGLLGRSHLERREGELILTLAPSLADLSGERVARRLGALANVLGLTPRMVG